MPDILLECFHDFRFFAEKGVLAMSRRMMVGGLLALAAITVSLGCTREESRIRPPAVDAKVAGIQAIALYDANKDGQISGEELDKCPALRDLSLKLKLGDQGVTADMITARIKVWHQSLIGLESLVCLVTHNGQPLEGAEVKFVPEKFLGDKFQIGTGTTNQEGIAMISIPTAGPREPWGVGPGFYRIVVSKPGLDIPAMYHSEDQTVLGVEAFRLPTAVKIDLAF
jgi:hypothetical protein